MSEISQRGRNAILKSLAAGLVPGIGLHHLVVGRKREIQAVNTPVGSLVGVGEGSARAENFIPPRPQEPVRRHLSATADSQLRELLQAGSSLRTWLGLGAHSGGWNSVAQLPMLFYVAVRTEGHKVPEGVVALLAPLNLVVGL